MKFKYYLSGIGWATCIVEINGQKLEFTASYLSDCLSDFLRSLMLLNSLCVPKDELRRKTECQWEGEPDGVIWSFGLKEEGLLTIEAIYHENAFSEDKTRTLLKTECLYDDFIMTMIREMDALIKRHGLIGYREEWYDFDFPIAAFLQLKHYIIHKQAYPVREVQGEHDIQTSSDLAYDIELLSREIT